MKVSKTCNINNLKLKKVKVVNFVEGNQINVWVFEINTKLKYITRIKEVTKQHIVHINI